VLPVASGPLTGVGLCGLPLGCAWSDTAMPPATLSRSCSDNSAPWPFCPVCSILLLSLIFVLPFSFPALNSEVTPIIKQGNGHLELHSQPIDSKRKYRRRAASLYTKLTNCVRMAVHMVYSLSYAQHSAANLGRSFAAGYVENVRHPLQSRDCEGAVAAGYEPVALQRSGVHGPQPAGRPPRPGPDVQAGSD